MSTTANASLITALTLTATLGGLLFGYDTAVVSGAVTAIDANFIAPQNLSETARDTLSGLTVSSALFGCVIGGLGAGWIATRLGRRQGLILAACLFLISAVGAALPELGLGKIGAMGAGALLPFNVYRIIGGVGVGLASMISPLYIAEISPMSWRGRLVSYNQIALVLGILLVYFVNWSIASQGDARWLMAWGWRWMFASEAVPAVLFFVLLLRIPDTPRWLVMAGREDAARDLLLRLMSDEEAARSLVEIKQSLMGPDAPQPRETPQPAKLLSFGPLVIFVGIMLSVFQQFVGINAVMYYAPLMFQNLGASTNSALLQTVVVGAANLVFTLIATATVDRLGRKPLMIAGAIIMAAAMAALGGLFAVKSVGLGALVAVVAYTAGFAMSWGPVTWVLLSEIFPNAIKGRAMAIAVAAQWVANLIVSWSFRVLDGNSVLVGLFHHGFTYWLYAAVGLVAALFTWWLVPETKGRSLESIQELWGHPPYRAADAAAWAAKRDAGELAP
jgi:SP family xylose:H+ symportor-like MFS transporter